jgi:hypothetical protein
MKPRGQLLIHTRIMFYKQRLEATIFMTGQIFEKIKQQDKSFLKY